MTTLHCPVCEQPFDSDASSAVPFCSQRCCQIDLGRWLNEEYRLPHETDEVPLDEQQ